MPQTIRVLNPTPEQIVEERRRTAQPSAAPPPPGGVTVRPPTPDEIAGAGRVNLDLPSLLPPPPPVRDIPLPKEGPHSIFLDTIVPAVTEIGSALYGGKAARGLVEGAPLLSRTVMGMLGTGGGGAVARGANDVVRSVPPPPGKILGDMQEAFVENAAGEGAAGGASAAWTGVKNAVRNTRLGAPLAGRVTEQGAEAARVLAGHVTPAQVSDSQALAVIDNLMSASLFGGGRYRKFIQDQRNLLRQKAQDLLVRFGPTATATHAGETVARAMERANADEIAQVAATGADAAKAAGDRASSYFNLAGEASERAGMARRALESVTGPARSPEETGKLWQSLQDLAHQTAKDTASKLYDDVDLLGAGVKVPLDRLTAFVTKEAERRGQLGMALAPSRVQGTAGAVRRAREAAEEVGAAEGNVYARQALEAARASGDTASMERITSLLDEAGIDPSTISEGLSFRQAHEVRSALGRQIRAAERATDPQSRNALGFLKRLRGELDTAMTDAAGGPDTDLRKAYDTATSAWKQMAQTFEEGLLADIAEKDPRLVVDTLIKADRVDDILKAKKEIGDVGWKAIQSSHLQSLLGSSKGGWATGPELVKRFRDLSPETIEALYGKGGSARLTEYLKRTLSAEGLGEQGAAAVAATAKIQRATAAEIEKMRLAVPEPYQAFARAIKGNNPENVVRMRALVGEGDWKAIQSAKVNEILQEGHDELASGKDILDRLHAVGRETLDAAFPRETVNGLYELARTMKQVQQQMPGGLKVWLQLTQGGTLAGVATGSLTWKALSVLGVPAVMTKVVMTPTARQWLTTGLRKSTLRDPNQATRALTQLSAWLVREGLAQSDRRQGGAAPPLPQTIGQTGRGAGPGPGALGGAASAASPPPPPLPAPLR